MRKPILVSLLLISSQVFGIDTSFELSADTTNSKSAFEVEKLTVIAEARYKIGNAKRLIEKARLEKKTAEEELQKCEDEVKTVELSEKNLLTNKNVAKTAKAKAEEDIKMASKTIQQASEEIAVADEAMQKVGVDINQQDELLQKLSTNIEAQKASQKTADSIIAYANEAKKKAAEVLIKAGIPAETYCVPKPMDHIQLRDTMYGFIHPNNHGVYFHQIGCDEDILRDICWNFVTMTIRQLEEFLKPGRGSYNCRHNFSPYMICDDGRRHPAEYDLAQMSLQNYLERSKYYTCLQYHEQGNIELKRHANTGINAADVRIREAEESKSKANNAIQLLEAELIKVTASKQELLNQKSLTEKSKITIEDTKREQEAEINAYNDNKESLDKEIAASTFALEKIAIELATAKLAKSRAEEMRKASEEVIEKTKIEIEILEQDIANAETALGK